MPVRNGGDLLREQLQALAGQTYAGAWEILVADNGSVDDTPRVVRSYSGRLPGLRVVDAADRPGPNHARNIGAAAARGDLLAYCDADDVASPGWLAGLVAAALSCDVVGGRLDHQMLNDETARAWRSTMAADGLPILMEFLPYAVSANLGLWSDVFRDLGGWNEAYGTGGDDVEISWRAQLRGYHLGFAPDAVMAYRHRRDLRGLARQAYRYGLAEPHLYRDFRSGGVPPKRLARAVRNWLGIVLDLPDLLRSPASRGLWLKEASFRWGRLRGSLRYRVLYV